MKYSKEQILAMPAGTPLNEIVAKEVMGYKVKGSKITINGYVSYLVDYKPSVDISEAWKVVEKLRKTHVYELADFGRNRNQTKQHYAAFHPIDKPRDHDRNVRAKTLEEAICKAALLAVMES